MDEKTFNQFINKIISLYKTNEKVQKHTSKLVQQNLDLIAENQALLQRVDGLAKELDAINTCTTEFPNEDSIPII
jgi:regulator of replication initiation timing